MIVPRVLVYDIETRTNGGAPDAAVDTLAVFGCWSSITGKFYAFTEVASVCKAFESHDVVVGFNTFEYDNKVLLRCLPDGYVRQGYGGKCTIANVANVDLYWVFKDRANIIKTKDGLLNDLLMSYSLDFITRTLGIVSGDADAKMKDFDYAVLRKPSWTDEEWRTIRAYLERDVDVTRKLWEWVAAFFESFKDFVTDYDVQTMKYITCRPAVFAYKAICKELGLAEEWDGHSVSDDVQFEGAFVSDPAGREFHDDVYCVDYVSLYPHAIIQCNLLSPTTSPDAWRGGRFAIDGSYDGRTLGRVETLMASWFVKRREYKKTKDPKEYTVKILLNATYGAAGNAAFKHLYNQTAASDCCKLGQQWVKLARQRFAEAGFLVIYTDTDSVYLQDTMRKGLAVLMAVKDAIIAEIKANVPFPQPTFDMALESEISDLWFFEGADGTLMKKNYIYRTPEGKVVVKNLGVRKKSTSAVTREIFWKHMMPRIRDERRVRFPRAWFQGLVRELLVKDLAMAASRYMVKDAKEYKNASQIQAQIAERYGAGIHFLLPNNRVGVGKGKKHCTMDEFRTQGLLLDDLDLSGVWNELTYFIDDKGGAGWGAW